MASVKKHHDPGLQRERTALAWSRTGLAVLVNALVVLRAGAQSDDLAVIALGALLLVASAGAVACAVWRSVSLAHHVHPATPVPLVIGTVSVAWLAGVAAIAAVLSTIQR
ncbi:MAG TPA: DUF202 domain-containing protein [Usitatibacter sp.]|nr:DUF202 domain-containing protein [Usitatibacter sp.]